MYFKPAKGTSFPRFDQIRPYRSRNTDLKTVLRVWGLAIAGVGATHYWMWKNNMWLDMWRVVWWNFPIWVVLGTAVLYGFWWYKTHQEFKPGEFVFYICMIPIFAYPGAALGYYWCTDLHDTEVWCGRAVQAEYVERYYTESTDSDGDTDRTWHGPYYYLHTNNGEKDRQDLTESQYENYLGLWGGAQRLEKRRNTDADSVSYIYTIDYDGHKDHVVYTATKHYWANVLRASHSLLKMRGAVAGYQQYLLRYPAVQQGSYGPIEFDRVLQAGVSLDSDTVSQINTVLRERLAVIGPNRECNVIVYITSAPIGVVAALKEHWCLGHNNDVTVMIGAGDGNTIDWVDVMAWPDDGYANFVGALKARIYDLKTIAPGSRLATSICDQINGKGYEGYKRLPREKLHNLISDISLPWWAFILIIIVTAIWLFPTIWLCIYD